MQDNTKKYMSTHGFIRYTLNLREASYKLWLLLGAAESKCRHLAGIPLRPEKKQELKQISLKKGIQATTAIEGNTLTEEDVDKIYRGDDREIPESRQYQAQEIRNVLKVYNEIAEDIDKGRGCEISISKLKMDNAQILEGVPSEDHIHPGEIRTYPVVVGNIYKAPPAEDCEYLLNRLFEWISTDWGLGESHKLVEGILKAILTHLYLVWIHPFGDGNGRSARVFEFRMLMKAGIPSTAAHLLTSYYNDTKDLYYDKLNRSSRLKDGELEFIEYAVQGFVDALDKEIASILDEQLKVTWENYVYEVCFGGKLTPALRRRRDLLIEISGFSRAVTQKELRYRLSGKLLKQYQTKMKALSLDINYLKKRGLIRETEKGYEAAKYLVTSFLPIINT